MALPESDFSTVWHLITRLGEAQLLLPAALAMGVALIRNPVGRSVVAGWGLLLGVATLVTLATKVAFMGWGVGSALLNFTGISGHTMLAAATYPVLLGALASRGSEASRWVAVGTGYGLALAVGASRVAVDAHSTSEVLGGLLLGGVVGAVALRLVKAPRWPLSAALLAGVAVWFSVVPSVSPPLPTHSTVTQLALAMSGRTKPFTRRDLLRATRHSQAAAAAAPPFASIKRQYLFRAGH